MVDVRRGLHRLHHGHRSAVDEVEAVLTEHEGHDPLVGSAVSGLEAQQARGLEVGGVHGAHRGILALDCRRQVLDVVGVSRLVGAAVHLPEDPAPQPPPEDCLYGLPLERLAPDIGAGSCERDELRGVREVSHAEDALADEQIARHVEPVQQRVQVGDIVLVAQRQNVLLLAARTALGAGALCEIRRVERHGGQKRRLVDALHEIRPDVLVFGADARAHDLVPVATQIEVVGGEGRRHELEHGKRDAPRVHVLEDLADRLAGRRLVQGDDRDLVVLHRPEDILLEVLPEGVLSGLKTIVFDELCKPIVTPLGVEYEVCGKHELLDLALTTREVEDDLATDVLGDDAFIRYGDNRILAVFLWIEAFAHIEVVEAAELLAALVRGADGVFPKKRAVQRGESLLAVEDEVVGLAGNAMCSLEGTVFQPHLTASALEPHERAHRIPLRQARDDVPDAPVIPRPAALELRELMRPLANPFEELAERSVI